MRQSERFKIHTTHRSEVEGIRLTVSRDGKPDEGVPVSHDDFRGGFQAFF